MNEHELEQQTLEMDNDSEPCDCLFRTPHYFGDDFFDCDPVILCLSCGGHINPDEAKEILE
jgi:hypothetical protein